MRGRGRRGGTITGFLMSVKQGFLYPAASSQFFFFFKDAAPFSRLEIKQFLFKTTCYICTGNFRGYEK